MNEPLAPDEVHVWYADPDRVTDPAVLASLWDSLSDEEQRRCERFVVERVRHEYLVAHGLLRRALSRYAPVPPEAWQFRAGPTGKPEVSGPVASLSLRFNLSHTRGLCACAVSLGREVGIDVEAADRQVSEALRACLAPEEAAQLLERPESERAAAFLEFWTLKEAYLKACGLGLRVALASVVFHLAPDASVRVSFGEGISGDPEEWQFTCLRPGGTHCVAVAVRRAAGETVVVRERGSGDLLSA